MSFFGGNGITGYNCEQVNALRDVINNTAAQAGQGIVDRLHSDIIVPMAKAWYAPEAVTFFEGLGETVKASGTNITQAFDLFRAAVEEAGRNWAENTGGQAPSLAAIDNVEMILNISDIQPENGGTVGIDENEATSIAARLEQVEQGIKADIQSLANNLEAESAFLGNNQAQSIEQCFVSISGEIHKIFRYLTEGEDSLQGQINAAVKKYQEVSGGIAGAFNKESGN